MRHKITYLFKALFSYITALLKNKKYRSLLFGGLILLSFLFIARAIVVNWSDLSQQNWEINFRYIVLAICLYPVGMLPTVIAWHYLLKAIGITKSFSTNLRFYSLSALPRHIPGLVWYVSSRSLLYQDIGISGTRIVVATGLETIFLTLTGCIVSLVWFSTISIDDNRFLPLQIAAFIAASAILVLIIWTPAFNRLLSRLQKKRKIENPIQVTQKEILFSLFWMLLAWIGGGALLFTTTKGFVDLDWLLLPSMIGIWGAAGAISMSLGALIQGMGLREITLGALLSSIVPLLSAVVIAIAFRLVLTIGEMIWVAIFSWITKTPSKISEGVSKD